MGVTFNEYIKDLLIQIRSSYNVFLELKDSKGDLEIIYREWIKINSLLQSLINRINKMSDPSDVHILISKLAKYYIENYYFEREINTMSELYSQDTNRLKNLRLKIIESFNDKEFIKRINIMIKEW